MTTSRQIARLPSAAATTNATLAYAGPCTLTGLNLYNASAAVRYLKIYNLAVAPTVGTSVPILTIAVKAATTFETNDLDLYLPTGLAYALTTGAADSDTAALTAADVVGLNLLFA